MRPAHHAPLDVHAERRWLAPDLVRDRRLMPERPTAAGQCLWCSGSAKATDDTIVAGRRRREVAMTGDGHALATGQREEVIGQHLVDLGDLADDDDIRRCGGHKRTTDGVAGRARAPGRPSSRRRAARPARAPARRWCLPMRAFGTRLDWAMSWASLHPLSRDFGAIPRWTCTSCGGRVASCCGWSSTCVRSVGMHERSTLGRPPVAAAGGPSAAASHGRRSSRPRRPPRPAPTDKKTAQECERHVTPAAGMPGAAPTGRPE